MLLKCCTLYASRFGKLSHGHRTEKGQFSFQPKERQCQRMFRLSSVMLISHASKVILKILQAHIQKYMNWELPDVQAEFRKGVGTRDHVANIHWIIEKARGLKKSTSASLTMLKPLTVWITTNWKILKEMGVPDHLTCLLRNLYAGQEATVRTGHGRADWFRIGKGVHQGCVLSPCLFNL